MALWGAFLLLHAIVLQIERQSSFKLKEMEVSNGTHRTPGFLGKICTNMNDLRLQQEIRHCHKRVENCYGQKHTDAHFGGWTAWTYREHLKFPLEGTDSAVISCASETSSSKVKSWIVLIQSDNRKLNSSITRCISSYPRYKPNANNESSPEYREIYTNYFSWQNATRTDQCTK